MAILWNKIKAEYLNGATPKELATKYELSAKQISNKANDKKWVRKKQQISEKIESSIEDDLKEISQLAVERLKGLLNDREIKNNDLVSAVRLALDTTLNKQKKEENSNLTNALEKLSQTIGKDLKEYGDI